MTSHLSYRLLLACVALSTTLWASLVLQLDSPGAECAGQGEPPLPSQIPSQRSGVEHAGIPKGFRLQAGTADGAREFLPRMVMKVVDLKWNGSCAGDGKVGPEGHYFRTMA
jgi:hypothetical protein